LVASPSSFSPRSRSFPLEADAQRLTGALVGTVKDADSDVMPGALVRVTCPALIGGARPS